VGADRWRRAGKREDKEVRYLTARNAKGAKTIGSI